MTYKVITLSLHSDLLQKVLRSGDIVTEDMFHEGHIPQLIEQKAIEPYEFEHVVNEGTLALNPELGEAGVELGETIMIPAVSDLTPEEEAAAQAEVVVPKKSTKKK